MNKERVLDECGGLLAREREAPLFSKGNFVYWISSPPVGYPSDHAAIEATTKEEGDRTINAMG